MSIPNRERVRAYICDMKDGVTPSHIQSWFDSLVETYHDPQIAEKDMASILNELNLAGELRFSDGKYWPPSHKTAAGLS